MVAGQCTKSLGFDELHRDVIGVGLCTACGTCIGICPARCIEFDYALEEPVLSGECKPCGLCYSVCPGKDIPLPELERMLFSRERNSEEELLGIGRRYIKGFASNSVIKQAGASGGCATALLTYALEAGIIDGAICVGMSPTQPWRAVPRLATTSSEILDCAQSKYVVVPVNSLLNEIEQRGIQKLGIVGLPCHIHGLRKIQLCGRPKNILHRIKFVIGLFCGSNFSFKATQYLIARFAGVPLSSIAGLEYRGGPNSQDMHITTIDGTTIKIPGKERSQVLMRMRRDRCSVCLDFSAELADVSIGDIFVAGTNRTRLPNLSAMIVRTSQGDSLLHGAEKTGYIKVSELGQSGFSHNRGLEQKICILPYYVLERRRFGWPTPDYHYEVKSALPKWK